MKNIRDCFIDERGEVVKNIAYYDEFTNSVIYDDGRIGHVNENGKIIFKKTKNDFLDNEQNM